MMIKAMEVSGIEGNFRTTCQNVMRVLRSNKVPLPPTRRPLDDPWLPFLTPARSCAR